MPENYPLVLWYFLPSAFSVHLWYTA